MNSPYIQITAPGMHLYFCPQDSEDMELVRVACADAGRRVRQAMRFALPEPPEDAEE